MSRLLRVFRFRDDLLGLDKDDARTRRIVRRMLTGHPNRARRRNRDGAPQRSFELLAGHPTGSKDRRAVAGRVDDGRLHADVARTTVENEVDGITELGTDVVRGRRAD